MFSARGPAAPALQHASPYLIDSAVFHWDKASFRTDLIFMVAIALCFAVGLGLRHPGAALIAGGGAMTVGFGAKQSIDDSRLLPMIFVSLGICFSTFVGMVAGHKSFVLVVVAALWGFGYGMLSNRQAGYGWVGQQCTVALLVASAFPFSARAAATRSLLVLVGGAVQVLCSSLLLRIFGQLRADMLKLARYVRQEETVLRATMVQAARSLSHGDIKDSALPYSLRLAVTLGICSWIYLRLHFASGYWIPMTALLVLKPGLSDTVSRASARTLGTILGAVLVSYLLLHIAPVTWLLALLTVVFAWLAYGTNNVNYALFSLFLTGYIVLLLSLIRIPAEVTAERRAICTALGGGIALGVRLVVIHRRQRRLKQSAIVSAA